MDKKINQIDNDKNIPKLFPFEDYDLLRIENLTKFVEELLIPQKVSAFEIQGFAHILLALRRLPVVTHEVGAILTISNRFEQELSYYDLSVDEFEFKLGYGGSVYDPVIGSDSYSHTMFLITPDGYGEYSENDIESWIIGAKKLLNLGGDVTIEDLYEDDTIDWDEDIGEKYRFRNNNHTG